MAGQRIQLEVDSSSSSGKAEERQRPSQKSRSSSKGHRSKVRTGCKTCKVRRLRCDEARPACVRCTSTGRLRDGYGPLAIANLPFDISGTEEERHSYHFFRLQTATAILGRQDAEYWTTSLLQMSLPTYSQASNRNPEVGCQEFLGFRALCSCRTVPHGD